MLFPDLKDEARPNMDESEMNPRIEEKNLNVYQKEPEVDISPKFTSFTKRKELEAFKESLNLFPSILLGDKTLENNNEVIKLDPQIPKDNQEITNIQDFDLIKAEETFNCPFKRIPKIRKKTIF